MNSSRYKNYLKAILLATGLLVICGIGAYQIPMVNQIVGILLINIGESTTLEVDGDTLIMSGVINSQTPEQLEKVFAENPHIDTIVMDFVPGSADDDANLRAASWIAKKDLTTKLTRYSFVASGGTDFFLAGKSRIIEDGASVGVHSWGYGAGLSAQDFPRGHEHHQPYIDYYQEVGFSKEDAEAFYYFTIDSATAEDVHIMSNEELVQYNISTEEIKEPAFIYLELEEERGAKAMNNISAAEAAARGISIRAIPADLAAELVELQQLDAKE